MGPLRSQGLERMQDTTGRDIQIFFSGGGEHHVFHGILRIRSLKDDWRRELCGSCNNKMGVIFEFNKKKLIGGTVLKLGELFLLGFFTYNLLISFDILGVKLSAPDINSCTLSNAIYVLYLTLAMLLVVSRTTT